MRSLLYVFVLASCAQVTDEPLGELQGFPTDPEDGELRDEMAEIDRLENPTYAAEDTPDPSDVPPCEGFPSEGACSQACNAEALRAYIPPGTCVTFECPYSDGTSVRVGGCVLPDE